MVALATVAMEAVGEAAELVVVVEMLIAGGVVVG